MTMKVTRFLPAIAGERWPFVGITSPEWEKVEQEIQLVYMFEFEVYNTKGTAVVGCHPKTSRWHVLLKTNTKSFDHTFKAFHEAVNAIFVFHESI